MDIYLSVNNRAEVMRLPVIPPSFTISKPQGTEVFETVYAGDTEITKNIGGVSWKNSIYELATTLSFETAKTDNAYLKDLIYTPKLGEVIRIVTNVEVFRGVVIKVDDGDINKNKYTAVDMGWYLNKTSQTYQFKDITVKDAIKEICVDLSIPIDEYGFLQSVIKIDTEKENADTVANSELWWNGRTKENFSFEIIEKYDSYTRAGEVIDLEGVRYVIESTDHSLVDGWHYDKLGLRKIV